MSVEEDDTMSEIGDSAAAGEFPSISGRFHIYSHTPWRSGDFSVTIRLHESPAECCCTTTANLILGLTFLRCSLR